MTKTQKVIFEECFRVMRGVKEGNTYNSFYFTGLVMSAEQALAGNEELALNFYAVALNQLREKVKEAIDRSL